jgi:hypothetical protein
MKLADARQYLVKADTTKNIVELKVWIVPFRNDLPVFENIRSLAIQPNEVNEDIGETVTGYRGLVFRYLFRNMDNLQQVEQELLATGCVIRISIKKL